MKRIFDGGWISLLALAVSAAAPPRKDPPFSDYRTQHAGTFHKILPSDLPPPHATKAVASPPSVVSRPKDAWPAAPAGFRVQLYADGLTNPRYIRTAPSGDVFVAESKAGLVRVFRGLGPDGRAAESRVFARGLRQPFGIAFYPAGPDPRWLYVGDTDAVVRFPYRAGDLEARGPMQTLAELPAGGRLFGGGHWTRDLAFSRDGKKLYVSVGSRSNNDDTDDNPAEHLRADILEMDTEGKGAHVYAWGIRNAVGIAVDPRTGELWASVNERDDLGDDLPPDYVTRVRQGGFYGWPWFYIGPNQDPRHAGKHPELRDKVIVPDVLVQPHNASLQMVFYDGKQFPPEYHGDIFAAEHGSWNRDVRTGYNVIRIPLHGNGQPTGEYQDFLTGFVTDAGHVWGRPVGVAVASDGALLVTDDGSNSIWRVTWVGGGK
jgi:glucose/arabinose dehydrogenase